jgi:hypothetical protein
MPNTTEHFHRPTERKPDTKIDLLIPRKDVEIVFDKVISPFVESFEKVRYELATSAFESTIKALNSLQSLKTESSNIAKVFFVSMASLPELIGGIKEGSKLIDAKKDFEESINKNAGRMKR